MTAKLLEDVVRPPLYPCTAKFVNDLPVAWNVHIVGVGAVFHYDDNTDLKVGPTAVDLAGGGASVALMSPDPKKCTVKVTGAMSVKAPGEAAHPFGKENIGTPGTCMLQTNFVLYPKQNVAKAAFEKGPTAADVVEVVVR
ncbi:hypothetical protein QEG98_42090 (plasmid) [Myxococcus sp. MxC21-1]|uniref:hypothetical protein n=1 Tax=Myxococcus sp. MxC21-1 TaxID=3041439 RepID=UPI00292DBD96|nr:hypothetical protein [Myxococcus sp. MxC21-1]WNZ66212.1 hypothetical protein QEG98_42090 [Myxococcus sp. MxC21-1]